MLKIKDEEFVDIKNHCINNSYSDLCEIWKD